MQTDNIMNPWPGLNSYDDSGRYLFCGRNKAIHDLYSLIANNSIATLYGRSGIGKTSLLKAGVMPLLRRRGLVPVYVRLMQEAKVSEDDGQKLNYAECIVRCIEFQMQQSGFLKNMIREHNDSGTLNYLWEYFCCSRFLNADGHMITPVIILDQFEELFSINSTGVAYLLRQIYLLIDNSLRLPDGCDENDFQNRFRFVLSFRDDSLYRIEDVVDSNNLTGLKRNRYLLKPLGQADAIEVIMKPKGDFVSEEDADLILEKAGMSGASSEYDPAILSLLMSELYRKVVKAGGTSVQRTVIEEIGNDVISNFYIRETGTEISSRTMEFLEGNLVTGDGRRKTIAEADLRGIVTSKELDKLEKGHILSKLTRGKYVDYELSHDVLCSIVSANREKREATAKLKRTKRMIATLAVLLVIVSVVIVGAVATINKLHNQRDELSKQRIGRLIYELTENRRYGSLSQRLLLANTICSKTNIGYNPKFDYECRQLLHDLSDTSFLLINKEMTMDTRCVKVNDKGEFLASGQTVFMIDSAFKSTKCAENIKVFSMNINAVTGDVIAQPQLVNQCCFGDKAIYYVDHKNYVLNKYTEGKVTSLIDFHGAIKDYLNIDDIVDIEYDRYSSSLLLLAKHFLYFYDIKRNIFSEKICLTDVKSAESSSSIESISLNGIAINVWCGMNCYKVIIFNRSTKGFEFLCPPTNQFHYSDYKLLYAENNEIKVDDKVICSCDSKIRSFSVKDNLIATLQDNGTIVIWKMINHFESERMYQFMSKDEAMAVFNGHYGSIYVINENLIATYQESAPRQSAIRYYKTIPQFAQNKVVADPGQLLLRYKNPNSKELFCLEEIQSNAHTYRISPFHRGLGALFPYEKIGGNISMFAYDLNGNMACFQNKDSLIIHFEGKYTAIPNVELDVLDVCVDGKSHNTAVLTQDSIAIYDSNGTIIASRATAQKKYYSDEAHKKNRILKFDGQECVYEESANLKNYRRMFWHYKKNAIYEDSEIFYGLESYSDFLNNYLFLVYHDDVEVYSLTNKPILLEQISEVEPIVFGDYIAVASNGTIGVFHFPSAVRVDKIECKEECIHLEYVNNAILATYKNGEVISYPFASYEDNISFIKKFMGIWVVDEGIAANSDD